MANLCYFCTTGELKKEKVNITRFWGKELVALNDVPALVCQQCGERYYDAKVSHEIDHKIKEALRNRLALPKIDVPVLQF
ncbi:type II toxin-antitoxin system MqsA family antitoxin [Candidatus Microgenomates bacterium]|nr:type II toxin-antitoxin system MqsA family antitoxin [Candidatus Microgenomates bacterium]